MSAIARTASTYLLLQAAAIAGWWLCLWCSADVRETFAFDGWPIEVLFAFALPDLLLMLPASVLAARGNRTALTITFACLLYATAWCLVASSCTGSAWLGTVMMALATIATGAILFGARRTSP